MAINEATFLACELAAKSATSKVLMRWSKPTEVFVSVQLPGRGAQSAAQRGRKWQGVAADAETLQQRLTQFGDLHVGTTQDYLLYLKRQGKKVATLQWSAAAETKELTELRTLLENVGHLAYAEALAYWEEGSQLRQYKQYEKAMQSLTTATKLLGDRYRTPDLRDDTGTYLVYAEHLARGGKGDVACKTHDGALRSRLAVYRQVNPLGEQSGIP